MSIQQSFSSFSTLNGVKNMIIIYGFNKLTVGERVVTEVITDENGSVHCNIPVFVKRECTKEEYLNHTSVTYPQWSIEQLIKGFSGYTEEIYYYEILMD